MRAPRGSQCSVRRLVGIVVAALVALGAPAALHLGRAAYFRRLRAAVARVAAHIATERRLKGG